MDKLKMAHEYALVRLTCSNPKTLDEIISLSWYYADAMQAEVDKRVSKERPDVLCEVNWRVAPCWAEEWIMRDGVAKWECETHANSWELAPSFGFTGSHIVERPNDF